ncbi:MAG: hypothetical protein H2174_04995 [Vampirovibrio sp.]|nr:hypothetical protein [Vampirovibrio sp.]
MNIKLLSLSLLALAVAGSMALTGCTGDTATPPATDAAPAVEATVSEPPAGEAPAGEAPAAEAPHAEEAHH